MGRLLVLVLVLLRCIAPEELPPSTTGRRRGRLVEHHPRPAHFIILRRGLAGEGEAVALIFAAEKIGAYLIDLFVPLSWRRKLPLCLLLFLRLLHGLEVGDGLEAARLTFSLQCPTRSPHNFFSPRLSCPSPIRFLELRMGLPILPAGAEGAQALANGFL